MEMLTQRIHIQQSICVMILSTLQFIQVTCVCSWRKESRRGWQRQIRKQKRRKVDRLGERLGERERRLAVDCEHLSADL